MRPSLPPKLEELALDRLGFYDWNVRWEEMTIYRVADVFILSALTLGFALLFASLISSIYFKIKNRPKPIRIPRAKVIP